VGPYPRFASLQRTLSTDPSPFTQYHGSAAGSSVLEAGREGMCSVSGSPFRYPRSISRPYTAVSSPCCFRPSSNLPIPGLSTAGAIILSISYGYDVSETQRDPLVTLAESTMDEFSVVVTPGAFLVDFVPWCASVLRLVLHWLGAQLIHVIPVKYIPAIIPGMGFLRKASMWRKSMNNMLESPYQFTRSQMVRDFITMYKFAYHGLPESGKGSSFFYLTTTRERMHTGK
jgi:hypothetical protein